MLNNAQVVKVNTRVQPLHSKIPISSVTEFHSDYMAITTVRYIHRYLILE